MTEALDGAAEVAALRSLFADPLAGRRNSLPARERSPERGAPAQPPPSKPDGRVAMVQMCCEVATMADEHLMMGDAEDVMESLVVLMRLKATNVRTAAAATIAPHAHA